jgi:hypothetical protein
MRMKKTAPKAVENYTLRLSIKETIDAIKKNLTTVAGSILIAILLTIAVSAVFALIVGSSLLVTMSDGFNPAAFGLGFIVIVLLAVAAFALISAFINIFISLSVNDGADGKKTTIGDVFKRSQKHVIRVIKTEILLALVVAAPLILPAAFSLTQLGNSRSLEGVVAYSGLMFLAVIAGIVWAVIALLRYCLAPIVVIFEPNVPVKQTLARSKHLMEKGGQWFVVKFVGLCLLILIVLSILFSPEQSSQGYGQNDSSFVDLISSLLSIFGTGMLVMLYRNRKVVRK